MRPGREERVTIVTDDRMSRLEESLRALLAGRFHVDCPEGDDDIGRLGRGMSELGLSLERKFSEMQALLRITLDMNAGLLIDEVLDRVYTIFRDVLPYD